MSVRRIIASAYFLNKHGKMLFVWTTCADSHDHLIEKFKEKAKKIPSCVKIRMEFSTFSKPAEEIEISTTEQ